MATRSESRPLSCLVLSGTSGSMTAGTVSLHAFFADLAVTLSRRLYVKSSSVQVSCAAASSLQAFDTTWKLTD